MTVGLPAGYRLPDDLAASVGSALERAAAERWVERCWQKDASLWSSDPEVQARISAAPGLAPRARGVPRSPGGARGVRRRPARRGLRGCRAPRHGRQLAGSAGARSMRSASQRAAWSSSSSTRPTRSRSPASATPATRRRRSTSSPASRARPQRRSASSPSSGTSSTTGAAAPSRNTSRPSPTRARAWRPIPHSDDFRSLFLNPPDVGGRFSALTYVGLVPAALLELDLAEILARGVGIAQRCREDGLENPGLVLGSRSGRSPARGATS